MTLLSDLAAAVSQGSIEVVDLTAPLSAQTPILTLPEPFGQTWPFALSEISRYDERGPAWYWNNITTGEHTGTHFDAPIHWVTGQDADDVSQVPARNLIAPAAVLDFSAEAAKDPDFLSKSATSRRGRLSMARCPRAAGCSTAQAGTHAPPTRRPSSTAAPRPASPPSVRSG